MCLATLPPGESRSLSASSSGSVTLVLLLRSSACVLWEAAVIQPVYPIPDPAGMQRAMMWRKPSAASSPTSRRCGCNCVREQGLWQLQGSTTSTRAGSSACGSHPSRSALHSR